MAKVNEGTTLNPRRNGTIRAEVTVDVEDLLQELDDSDIEAEYEERGLGADKMIMGNPGPSLADLVRERHDTEHSGNLACCPDQPACHLSRDAVTLVARDVHLYDGGASAAISGPHAQRIADAILTLLATNAPKVEFDPASIDNG